MASFASFAASEFEGTWAVKNTNGEPFEIALAADGTAKSTLPEADKGTWKEEGGAAVISWEFRLDQQDRKRGRQVREDGLQERRGPRRSADQHVRRRQEIALKPA